MSHRLNIILLNLHNMQYFFLKFASQFWPLHIWKNKSTPLLIENKIKRKLQKPRHRICFYYAKRRTMFYSSSSISQDILADLHKITNRPPPCFSVDGWLWPTCAPDTWVTNVLCASKGFWFDISIQTCLPWDMASVTLRYDWFPLALKCSACNASQGHSPAWSSNDNRL